MAVSSLAIVLIVLSYAILLYLIHASCLDRWLGCRGERGRRERRSGKRLRNELRVPLLFPLPRSLPSSVLTMSAAHSIVSEPEFEREYPRPPAPPACQRRDSASPPPVVLLLTNDPSHRGRRRDRDVPRRSLQAAPRAREGLQGYVLREIRPTIPAHISRPQSCKSPRGSSSSESSGRMTLASARSTVDTVSR